MERAMDKKPGIWTQHVDPSSGRAFYFNMALGRSFWDVPDDVKAQVQQPLVDELRRWDLQAMNAKYGADADPARQEELKRRREAIATAKAQEAAAPGATLTLQERMAVAAQRQREEEVAVRKAAGQEETADKQGDQSNEYLAMVRELQHVDRDTDTSGGKWLVR